jgi:hypothetical protein
MKNTTIGIGIACTIVLALTLAVLSAGGGSDHPIPLPPIPVPNATQYGAEFNPTGDPIGGGTGYSRGITGTDPDIYRIVSSKPELIDALATCPEGKIVFVDGDAQIDLSGTWEIRIPAGVTLASDRGYQGSSGARLFQNRVSQENYATGAYYHFLLQISDSARITGIRLEGPDKDTTMFSPMNMCRQGIMARGSRHWEIDNCEIWGWSWAGIYTLRTATSDGTSSEALQQGGYIHHNSIHHCQANGLGYGVDLDEGSTALIEANLFDSCRHVIAAEGYARDGYEARYNIVGENSAARSSHRFDMHADPASEGKSRAAGNFVFIHHNTVMTPFAGGAINSYCVDIQGVPRTGAYISNNWFYATMLSSQPVFPDLILYPVITENNPRGERVVVTSNMRGSDRAIDAEGPLLIL